MRLYRSGPASGPPVNFRLSEYYTANSRAGQPKNRRPSNSPSISVNNCSLSFDLPDVGDALRLEGENGRISGTITGGYDDFAISCAVKKGNSNLPESKEGGDKSLAVSMNNGDVDITFDKAEA